MQRDEANRKRSRKRKRSKVVPIAITLFVVFAVLVAGGVYAWQSGLLESLISNSNDEATSDVVTASYLSIDPINVASSTHIVPKDEEGVALSSYVVRVKQADALDGTPLEIWEMPSISVSGTDGFTLGDFKALDQGTYYLCVTDSADIAYDLPPLTIEGKPTVAGEVPVTVEITPDSSSGGASQSGSGYSRYGKYARFSEVLSGLEESSGEASLSVAKLDENNYLAWVAGTAFAELVDFGDGTERLLVVYCTDASFAASDVVELETDEAAEGNVGPSKDDYSFELWEYDMQSDAANCVLSGNLAESNIDDGQPVLQLLQNPGTGEVCLYVDGKGLSGSSAEACYGLTDAGVFGAVETDSGAIARWQPEKRCLLAHQGMSEESALGDASAEELSCEETAQAAKDLSTKLKAAVGV